MLPPDYIFVKIFNNTVAKAVYNEDKKGYEILDAYLGSFADMTCKENFNKFKDFEAGEAFTSLVFKEPNSANSDSSFTFEYFVFLDPQLAFKPTYTL
jgi:hypothetical protein